MATIAGGGVNPSVDPFFLFRGVITLNVAEADDVERERRWVSLHEPYRTLLGHMRREIADFYWDRLVATSQWLKAFPGDFWG
jgi:hypothetical protein